jgi:peptide deformylase
MSTDLELVQDGHQSLKIVCQAIDIETENPEDYTPIIKRMGEIMLENEGMGLAANQVQFHKRLFIMKIHDVICPFFNPEIIESSGKYVSYEGCLSFRQPIITLKIKRKNKIKMKFLNEFFKEKEIELEGIQAVCAQHEIDHLNGVTFKERRLEQKNKTNKFFKKRMQ